MSTPIGNSGNPIDPTHGLDEAYERASPRHHPVESEGERARSPYPPTRARERAGTERPSEENNQESILSRYAPKRGRTQPVQERDVAVQPTHPHDQQHEQLAAGRDAGIAELKRLEASLRWLQREEAATRIPRAVQLPPVPGLALAEVRGRRLAGESLDFPPRSLDPERMPPPPATRSRRHRLLASLIILIAAVVAVPIGYYFWTAGRTPSSYPAAAPQVASLAQKTDASLASIGQQEFPRTVDRDDRGALPPTETPSQAAETPQPQPRPLSAAETVAGLQPSATGNQASPASKAIRVLGPEEIKLLMKQGEQLIAAGDLAAARTVLQRAAEAGDADAAIMLGATFDPNVLAKLGVVGVSADLEKARHWYQEAESLGSPDARRRLDTLANR